MKRNGKFMKICLASIPIKQKERSLSNSVAPSPTLGILAAVILKEGFDCDIIDGKYLGMCKKDFMNIIKNKNYDVLGISIFTQEIDEIHEFVGKIKNEIRGITVVVGGPHVTALPRETLANYHNFDFAIYGEGEKTIVEFLTKFGSHEKYREIKGLVFRSDKEVVQNPPREFIQNLDELPFPMYELLPSARAHMIQTHRGCPYACSFCYRTLGKKVRMKSPKKVVDEIEYALSLSTTNRFIVSDSSFAVDQEHAMEILDEIIKRGINRRTKWDAQTKVSLAKRPLLEKMKAAGCDLIGFGFESGDNEILKMTGKDITVEQGFECVKLARDLGFKVFGYFIFGHPNETRESVVKTINYAAALNPDSVTFGIMVPWPGTKVYEWAKRNEKGYKLIDGPKFTHYHKHFGTAVHFEHVTMSFLKRMRLWGYIKVYLKNRRYFELLTFILTNAKPGFLLLKTLFKTRGDIDMSSHLNK